MPAYHPGQWPLDACFGVLVDRKTRQSMGIAVTQFNVWVLAECLSRPNTKPWVQSLSPPSVGFWVFQYRIGFRNQQNIRLGRAVIFNHFWAYVLPCKKTGPFSGQPNIGYNIWPSVFAWFPERNLGENWYVPNPFLRRSDIRMVWLVLSFCMCLN